MTPEELVETASDKESFLEFVEALRLDRKLAEKEERKNPSSPYGPDAGGWRNTTIDSFLEAAIGWAEDTDFGINRIGEASPWRTFAEFLLLGKLYE